LIAQNDNSTVVKLDADGKASVVYSDTHTGGSLSMNSKGALFIVARGLRSAIVQLAPRRGVLADRYRGDALDCLGGNPNDLAAAGNGSVYFTQFGVYHANPNGVVTRYGENITPNGIILSADEKTLYVTNGPALAAFDVQPDGSLTNQREFARLEGGGNGDGSAIDAAGRIYVTTNPRRAGDKSGRQVSRHHSNAARRDQRGLRRQGTRGRCSFSLVAPGMPPATRLPTPPRSTRSR
jgi:sugar lactone lactonase YvrE